MSEEFIESCRKEREEINRKIQELVVRRNRLEQLIHEVSANAYLVAEHVTLNRKNRKFLITWGLIRRMLLESQKEKRRGMETREIYDRLCEIHGRMNYGTLRSYVHRLKAEGKIIQRNKTAPWHLSDSEKQKEVSI